MSLSHLAMAAALACTPSFGSHRWSAPEEFIAPTSFNGVNGLVTDHADRLIAASVFGGQLWSVDRATGAAAVLVDRPDGQSDDVAISPSGGMAWTSILEGKLRYRANDYAQTRVVASLPGINSLRFDPNNGRLYAAQVFGADALWEVDVSGVAPPRLIASDLGGFNGFDVSADGMLYGPIMTKGQIARVDPETGALTVIATGFSAPSGVKIDAQGDLWVVDTVSKKLSQVDHTNGQIITEVQFDAPLDNLAISSDETIYISDVSRNAIHAYTPQTGELRQLSPPGIAIPAGLALADGQLWVANGYVLRTVDTSSKAVAEQFPKIAAPFPFTISLTGERLVISSTFTNMVEVFDRHTGISVLQIDGLSAPSDAILLSDGSLLYAEYGAGRVVRAVGDDFSKRTVIAVGLDGPVHMSVTLSGQLYVLETGGRLIEISLTAPHAIREIVTGLVAPEGMAETPWGTLVVAEVGQRRLIEVDPKTGARWPIAQDLPIGLSVPSDMPKYDLPTGVAVGKDGTIYLSSDENNAVYSLSLCEMTK